MSLTVQFLTTLAMIGMGIEVGAAFDTYKRFIKKQKALILFINDFLFWVCQGLLIFFALLNVNEGELRVIIFVELLCGYAMYQSLFRSPYLYLLEKLIRIGLATYRFLRKLITALLIKPFIWLLQLTLALCMMIAKVLYTILLSIWKFIYAIISWIAKILYSLLPKKVKKGIEKVAGLWLSIQNKGMQRLKELIKWIKKWRS
jgi:spore cortex biosynthesis protein YabQ